jgi:hypothetical protein
MKETTDAMCDCDGPPVDPGLNIYLPVVEAQPTIAAVYQFFPRAAPSGGDARKHREQAA